MSTSYQRILGYGFGRLVLVYRLSLSPPEVVVIRELEDLAYPTRNYPGRQKPRCFSYYPWLALGRLWYGLSRQLRWPQVIRVRNGCVFPLDAPRFHLYYIRGVFCFLFFCFHEHSRVDGVPGLCRMRIRLGKVHVMLLPYCRPHIVGKVSIHTRVSRSRQFPPASRSFGSIRHGASTSAQWILLRPTSAKDEQSHLRVRYRQIQASHLLQPTAAMWPLGSSIGGLFGPNLSSICMACSICQGGIRMLFVRLDISCIFLGSYL